MSLKAFHIFFIFISIVFLLGFGFWSFQEYGITGDVNELLYALFAAGGIIALIIYGAYFLKKMKRIKAV